MSKVSLTTGVTMKKCPCRMARPFGPSTRRSLTATEPRAAGEMARRPEPSCSDRVLASLLPASLVSKGFLVLVYIFLREKPKPRTDLTVGSRNVRVAPLEKRGWQKAFHRFHIKQHFPV